MPCVNHFLSKLRGKSDLYLQKIHGTEENVEQQRDAISKIQEMGNSVG